MMIKSALFVLALLYDESGGVEDILCNWPSGQQFWPHPTNCLLFVQCGPAGPVEMNCAPGTAWSQSLLTCDHLANTECGKSPSQPQAPGNEEQESSETEAPDNEYLDTKEETPSDPEAPDNAEETPSEAEYPDNTEETPSEAEYPDNAEEMESEPKLVPRIFRIPPMAKLFGEFRLNPPIVPDGKSGGVEDILCNWPSGQQFWPHPTNCLLFVQCGPSGPVEMNCGPGTAWSQSLLTCDHLANTECGKSPSQPQAPDNEEQELSQTEAPDNEYPDNTEETPSDPEAPDNAEETPYEAEYPDNAEETPSEAEYPDNAEEIESEPKLVPRIFRIPPMAKLSGEFTLHPPIVPDGKSGHVVDIPCNWPSGQQFWPHPTNCRVFVQCGPSGPVEMNCGPGTAWSQSLLTCDHLANTDCGKSLSQPQGPDNEEEMPSEPESPDNAGKTSSESEAPDNAKETPSDPEAPDNAEETPSEPETPDNAEETPSVLEDPDIAEEFSTELKDQDNAEEMESEPKLVPRIFRLSPMAKLSGESPLHPPIVPDEECKDEVDNCHLLTNYCKAHDGIKKLCSRTCGACLDNEFINFDDDDEDDDDDYYDKNDDDEDEGVEYDENTDCKDDMVYCKQVAHLCGKSKLMNKRCRETCGFC